MRMIEVTARRAVPRGQIAAILIGFPALYMVNSFAPWSRQLFAHHDQRAWIAFWGSAFVLWWASVAAALVTMRRAGWTLRDAGIPWVGRQRAIALGTAVFTGLCAVAVREAVGRFNLIAPIVDAWTAAAKPHTIGQRLLWIVFGVVSAAFCEEFVYRGFGFHAMRSRGMRVVLAAALASLAWIGVHGLGAIFGFPLYALLAVVLMSVVIRTDSLVPTLVIPALLQVFVFLGS
jgi:hypothetical protein